MRLLGKVIPSPFLSASALCLCMLSRQKTGKGDSICQTDTRQRLSNIDLLINNFTALSVEMLYDVQLTTTHSNFFF